ncbi:hypothetical protein MTO96_034166, partial [Rhipicephalus appendiculatus]
FFVVIARSSSVPVTDAIASAITFPGVASRWSPLIFTTVNFEAMDTTNRTDGETTTTRANSQGMSGSKSRKRSKSRDGKPRRASSTDDGPVK